MWGSGGQKIFTTSKRNWGWDNCSGCSVFDSNDSWVSLTLLTAPVAISVSVGSFRKIKISLSKIYKSFSCSYLERKKDSASYN